ncbi:MAG: thioredoxin domain-containing protein [Steroidobacteraceae bacterium]
MTTSPSPPQNRLGQETSPYLAQHATNPVDWYPWGPEAQERARRENRPILLSIGYSACHWCHVMAHESFEDPVTAALMNELFVNVKVDREERPDVDRIYQMAHQMLTQRGGGWPLTMFLTPGDQQPFFGGTYFPPEPKYGMPGFRDILKRVAEYFRTHAEDIAKQNAALTRAFAEMQPIPVESADRLQSGPLQLARGVMARDFDRNAGGFGGAPKFPHPTYITFLLRQWRATAGSDEPDLQSLFMATLTLTRMAEGGVYDQLGGGFCRYSVDAEWTIPHFEKMLYDNAQLIGAYAQAAVATGDPLFRTIALETAEWVLRDLGSPEGAFWSTLDADSEGHEGRFYVWTPDEIRSRLSPESHAVFASRFGLDGDANFEGSWHLRASRPVDAIAAEQGLTVDAVNAHLQSARATLLALRNSRVWPQRDEKILTSWNGLMISGLAIAARALARDDLGVAATRAVDFIRGTLWQATGTGMRLFAVHKDGRTRFPAYLDDHAFLLAGLLDLLETRWRTADLKFAIDLAEILLAHFEDRESGGFYFTADDHEALLHRPKAFQDDAVPSGNGVAALALGRLGALLGEPRYLDAAERVLKASWSLLERYPQAHATLLMALDEYLQPVDLVIIRGDAGEVALWQSEISRIYSPKRLVFGIPKDAAGLPAALAAKQPAESAVAYICRGTTCSEPVRSLSAVISLTRG